MRCGHCSKEIIIGDAKFCPYCSSDLSVCPNCGKRNPDEALFCMYCTAPLRASDKDVFAAQDVSAKNPVPNSKANGTGGKILPVPKDRRMKSAPNPYMGKTCPYCQAPFKDGTDVVLCRDCNMPHHRGCWEENGNKCTTFGCAGAVARTPEQSTDTESPPLPAREPVALDVTEAPAESSSGAHGGIDKVGMVFAGAIFGAMAGVLYGSFFGGIIGVVCMIIGGYLGAAFVHFINR